MAEFRIAYVINSLEGGGAALPVPAVTRLMRAHGAHVEVFALTRRDGRALEAMERSGLAVHVREGAERDHLAAMGWLRRKLSLWRPDVVWTSLTRATLLGQIAAGSLGVPVVSWQHAAFLKPANHLLLRAMQARSKLWVADSACVAELTARRLGVGSERLATWALFAADPAARQAAPWRPGEPIRIGTLGRLHPVKGHDVLIEALADLKRNAALVLPPFEVAIAGEGKERAALEARLASHGLDSVSLPGFAEQPQAFLAGLHLYVQPSRSEGLCVAVHEAMQAGLPTIASAVGEMPYSILPGETGLVVPPDDAGALARALASLLMQPERLTAMGAAARARVLSRFGPEAFAQAGAGVMSRLPISSGRAVAPGRSPSQLAKDPVSSHRAM